MMKKQCTTILLLLSIALTLTTQTFALPWGVAFTSKRLQETDFTNAMTTYRVRSITPENEMKMGVLQPQKGTFDFSGADAIITYAKAHDMGVRGHTLVWHKNIPAWVTDGTWTKAQLTDILDNHIETVVGHMGNDVYAWDVVNEALDDTAAHARRASIWQQTIGDEYIAHAFIKAHQINPTIPLYYNDYGIIGTNGKSDAVYAMVKSLLEQGVPITGVGFQSHLSLNSHPTVESMQQNMQRFVDLGLEVSVTELDVAIGSSPATAQQLAEQEQIYRDVISACMSTGSCAGITTWGLTDKYTWLTDYLGHTEEPLPLNATYEPKAAYQAITDMVLVTYPEDTPTPLPTQEPTPDPTAACAPIDLDCDGRTELSDFSVWRSEYLDKSGVRADWNDDGQVSLLDYELWRAAYLAG